MSDDLRQQLEDSLGPLSAGTLIFLTELIESRERAALERSQSEAFIAGCLYGGIPVEDTEIIVKAYHEWRKEALQQSGRKVEE